MVTNRETNIVDPSLWAEHLFGLSEHRWESLKDKYFWITGAGTGYGRSISAALACAGSGLFLSGRRRSKLLETVEEINRLTQNAKECHVIEMDITDEAEIKSAKRKITDLCDTVCGVVNNAAIPPVKGMLNPLKDYTLEDWERIFATNLTAPWLLTRAIFDHMAKGGKAKALFISSGAGWAFTGGYGPYNISKTALNSLAGCMAQEYAARYPEVDVQMNTLDPGEARTEMNDTSSNSPYEVVKIALLLLSQPKGGPNGKYFHRDGRSLPFLSSKPYECELF